MKAHIEKDIRMSDGKSSFTLHYDDKPTEPGQDKKMPSILGTILGHILKAILIASLVAIAIIIIAAIALLALLIIVGITRLLATGYATVYHMLPF